MPFGWCPCALSIELLFTSPETAPTRRPTSFLRGACHIYTQISPIVPNIWNPHRDMAEILKLHELGMRLLLNPNKYGYWL